MLNLLLALAVLPGIVFMIWVYRQDRIESEPIGLILLLLLFGALSAFPTAYVESFLEALNDRITDPWSTTHDILKWFICVGLSEEGFKYLVTWLISWRRKAFNFKFDGIVYAVSASLGFAILENVYYCFAYGFHVALLRAVLSVPGHGMYGIFMGYHYGLAKHYRDIGDTVNYKEQKWLALIVPVLLHGFYDYNAAMETWAMLIAFYAFVILLYIFAFRRIKAASRTDTWIGDTRE